MFSLSASPSAPRWRLLLIVAPAALLAVACGPSNSGGGGDDGCDPNCEPGQVCEMGMCVTDDGPCEPGETGDCYTGPAGTVGVGTCASGTRTCGDNGLWSRCEGEVKPVAEMCGNGVDDDCNGAVDDDVDEDNDGYTTCGGDCCDRVGGGCAVPALVNPGAFEVGNNMVDDDCDGIVDNSVPECDTGLPSNSADAMQYANAIGLCQMATGNRWGVVSAKLSLANGSGTPNPTSHAIRTDFGASSVRQGMSMAVFSTGHAADATDTNPAFAAFEIGEDMSTTSAAPSDWLTANGGSFPNPMACPPADDNVANDPVMLELTIKVPTNARSFSIDSNFFSAEYPEWVCTEYNDFFVILLDSTYNGDPANPTDKNLARYTAPDMTIYPVGVNLAYNNTGLFQVCTSGATGCQIGGVASTNTCALGTNGLSGTGFDQTNGSGCAGGSNQDGGGTGWLATSGNVVPGETITLRIAIWDTSDHIYDSLVLLDNFQWSVDASDPGTIIIE